MISRRALLQGLGALTAFGLSAPSWAGSAPRRSLILLELKGGHDDLFSLPPTDDPAYLRLRPTLAIPSSELMPLGGRRAMHPMLGGLKAFWERGEMALVQGVGTGVGDLSHFRTAQQWETGTVDQPDLRLGWLARAWDQSRPAAERDPNRIDAAVFGLNPGPFAEPQHLRLVRLNSSFPSEFGALPNGVSTSSGPNRALDHLLDTYREGAATQQLIMDRVRTLPPPASAYPNHPLATSLQCVAALMSSPQPPSLFKLTIEGFDAHVGQRDRYPKVFRPVVPSLLAFRSQLQRLGLWSDTTLATYSEFGRRPAENPLGVGTDHGEAATQLVMGGAVRAGFHGEMPRLGELSVQGNVPTTLDFRCYYNSLWMQALNMPAPAFPVDIYPPLSLIG